MGARGPASPTLARLAGHPLPGFPPASFIYRKHAMNPLVAGALSAFTSGGVAYLLGWLIHRGPADVEKYMAPVVPPIEEREANERRLRRIAFDAGRIALPNIESGEPARIARARMSSRPSSNSP